MTQPDGYNGPQIHIRSIIDKPSDKTYVHAHTEQKEGVVPSQVTHLSKKEQEISLTQSARLTTVTKFKPLADEPSARVPLTQVQTGQMGEPLSGSLSHVSYRGSESLSLRNESLERGSESLHERAESLNPYRESLRQRNKPPTQHSDAPDWIRELEKGTKVVVEKKERLGPRTGVQAHRLPVPPHARSERSRGGQTFLNHPVIKGFLVIISAILTGVVLGLSVLAFMSSGLVPSSRGEEGISKEAVASPEGQALPSLEGGNSGGQTSEEQVAAEPLVRSDSASSPVTSNPGVTSGVNFSAAERTVYILQAGVFSDSSRAEQIAEAWKTSHVPVVITHASPYRVILGVSVDKEAAQALAHMYVGAQETYVKEWQLVPPDDIAPKIRTKGQAFFVESVRLTMVHLLAEEDGQTLPQALQELAQLHREYLAAVQDSGSDGEKLTKETAALNRIMDVLNAYGEEPHPDLLRQAQEAQMQYVVELTER